MQFKKEEVFTIPNILTYIRLLAVPFFWWMMLAFYFNPENFAYLWAGFGLFIGAEITDIADGYIARHFNQVSDIGKVLDPTADKLLQGSGLILLAVVGGLHWAFAVLIVLKEIYIGASSKYYMVAGKRQVAQQANKLGKAGAVINFIAIILAFFVPFKQKHDWVNYLWYVDIAFLVLSVIMSAINAVQYTIGYNRQLKNLRESGVLDKLDRYGNPINQEEAAVVEDLEKEQDNEDK